MAVSSWYHTLQLDIELEISVPRWKEYAHFHVGCYLRLPLRGTPLWIATK